MNPGPASAPTPEAIHEARRAIGVVEDVMRATIMERLDAFPQIDDGRITIANVRQDHGNIAFDVEVDGRPAITRIFHWGTTRYADGKP